MILTLLLLSLFLAVAHGASALVVSLLVAFDRNLLGLTAALRTKLYWAALFAPLALAGLVLATVMGPSLLELAGVAGHCEAIPGHHTHLCFLHFSARPSLPLVLAGSLLPVLTLIRGVRSYRGWAWERRAVLSLVRTGRPRAGGSGVVEFDSAVPICVTLGLRSPNIFVSSAAMRALGPADLGAALEHERAHVMRRDDLALLAGRVAALLHVPPYGRKLLARWQQESEIVCDAIAARRTGAPADLAGAIVRFHRALVDLRRAAPSAGACLCQTSATVLDRRVRALLHDSAGADQVHDGGRFAIGVGLLVLGVGLLLQAGDLHHAIESALGILGVLHA